MYVCTQHFLLRLVYPPDNQRRITVQLLCTHSTQYTRVQLYSSTIMTENETIDKKIKQVLAQGSEPSDKRAILKQDCHSVTCHKSP